MALIDVDIEDYLEEVSTSRLVAEIRSRRREPQFGNRVFHEMEATHEEVVERLRIAFDTRDPAAFERALELIPAEASESRVQQIQRRYAAYLSEKQGARAAQ